MTPARAGAEVSPLFLNAGTARADARSTPSDIDHKKSVEALRDKPRKCRGVANTLGGMIVVFLRFSSPASRPARSRSYIAAAGIAGKPGVPVSGHFGNRGKGEHDGIRFAE
jgi:hypothetical protein